MVKPIYANKFQQCDLGTPKKWSRDSVSKLLRIIDQRLAKAKLTEEQRPQLALLMVQLEQLKSDEKSHEENRLNLQKLVGVNS